jgi:hypothetical protein
MLASVEATDLARSFNTLVIQSDDGHAGSEHARQYETLAQESERPGRRLLPRAGDISVLLHVYLVAPSRSIF